VITVHHLNESRSHRILWLLEELELPYEIRSYRRDPHTRLAPMELKEVHPLGKSPVVSDDDGTVVAESGAIIDYVVRRHGNGRMQPAAISPLYDQYVQWLHYAEGSAMLPLIMKLTVSGLSFVLNHGKSAAPLARHVESEIVNHLGYINGALAAKDYLLGDEMTAADIQMSFVGEQAARETDLSAYPNLSAWLRRMQARPAYRAALTRGNTPNPAA
jgi:glutathione S-transferase